MTAPLAITALAGLLAVIAAVVALLTVRLERMAGAVAVAAGALALAGTVAAGPALGGLLALGGIALCAPVAAAAIAVGLDGRPPRTPRPWKLALLLPVAVLVVAILRAVPVVPAAGPGARASSVVAEQVGLSTPADAPAFLALLGLAAAAVSALLLARRREAA
jgi:hypothetical protein